MPYAALDSNHQFSWRNTLAKFANTKLLQARSLTRWCHMSSIVFWQNPNEVLLPQSDDRIPVRLLAGFFRMQPSPLIYSIISNSDEFRRGKPIRGLGSKSPFSHSGLSYGQFYFKFVFSPIVQRLCCSLSPVLSSSPSIYTQRYLRVYIVTEVVPESSFDLIATGETRFRAQFYARTLKICSIIDSARGSISSCSL